MNPLLGFDKIMADRRTAITDPTSFYLGEIDAIDQEPSRPDIASHTADYLRGYSARTQLESTPGECYDSIKSR